MSINFGIYDFFSYFVPGMLYLFTANELLRVLGWKFIDIGSWLQSGNSPSLLLILPAVAFAYVIGHVMDLFANTYFRLITLVRTRNPFEAAEKALEIQKDAHPKLDIRFSKQDWFLLFNLISQRNIEASRVIDKYQADSIMLRNISFIEL